MVSPGTCNPVGMMYQQGVMTPSQIRNFQEAYSKPGLPEWHVQVAQEEDGLTTFYFNGSAGTEGRIVQTHSADTVASILHIAQTKGAPVQQVHVDILSARAKGQVETVMSVPVYAGFDAGVSLVDAEAGPFHTVLGVAADTEIGCRDQSVGCKVLGCGARVGRVCEISAFGSSVGIDWEKLKWW
ncbi:hypothetical protein C8A00DRAFT_42957 [Chaetomidium leptoderma]|uniref:Uncharacterized protein n=1 Tax=Chaetomidium leptoderma TaxID=669021 RepID=A0AAN6ZX86_9PEZI|nr:hypothetical protein C8A00DRAFT_42957 [Chaetomidium leptoderma]